jgi:CheY-like chemotaxis protein
VNVWRQELEDPPEGSGEERSPGVVRELVSHPPLLSEHGLAYGTFLPLRLLIADDYVDAAESLAMLLSQVGAQTVVAYDGEQALVRAAQWRPHVCVLDIEMPKLDGREVARRIRMQPWAERPLLIALTGWTTAHDARRALEAGFDHYLIKPVEPLKLVRLILDYHQSAQVNGSV